MTRKEVMVAGATLTLITFTLALSLVGQVLPTVQTSRTVPNAGTIKAIGVGVYRNRECTIPLPSIDWGILEPGSSKNETCYIRNEGNSPSTLSMYTSNWYPPELAEEDSPITLSWDYNEQPINPDEAIPVTFTLSISASVEGITSFSFDITIVGSG